MLVVTIAALAALPGAAAAETCESIAVTVCADPDAGTASACNGGYLRHPLGIPVILQWEACAGVSESGPFYYCWTKNSVNFECPQP